MIVIDTDILDNLVPKAKSANEDISDAVRLLHNITIHNDWNCAERITINSNTSNNKAKITRLQQSTESFLNAVISSAKEIKTIEINASNSIPNLDKIISVAGSVIKTQKHKGTNINDYISKTTNSILDRILKERYGILPDDGGISAWGGQYAASAIKSRIENYEAQNIAVPICAHLYDTYKI